ncbi:VOC family protein [Paenibacillus kobensis]|uniref:VOC family protein n=1 Tax=Paenibacillus kobensis TaxID=59841 RepID=UPI0013E2ECE5|nr:VOC family protein [Paenibacillus kobensis]
MKWKQTGIILFVENYQAALRFYTEQLCLQVQRQEEGLTVMDFGGAVAPDASAIL